MRQSITPIEEAQFEQHGHTDQVPTGLGRSGRPTRPACRPSPARRRRETLGGWSARLPEPRWSPLRTRAHTPDRWSVAATFPPFAPAPDRIPSRAARAAAKMKPRASIPATRSTGACCPATSVSAQITVSNAVPSASSGTMSLKTIPGCGKSGTSRSRASMTVAASVAMLTVAGGIVAAERRDAARCRPAAAAAPPRRRQPVRAAPRRARLRPVRRPAWPRPAW